MDGEEEDIKIYFHNRTNAFAVVDARLGKALTKESPSEFVPIPTWVKDAMKEEQKEEGVEAPISQEKAVQSPSKAAPEVVSKRKGVLNIASSLGKGSLGKILF